MDSNGGFVNNVIKNIEGAKNQAINDTIANKMREAGIEPNMEQGYSSGGKFYNTTNEQELLNRINQTTGNNYTGLAKTDKAVGNDYPLEVWRQDQGWKSVLPSYSYNNVTGNIDVSLPDWMKSEGENGSTNTSFYKQTIAPILESMVGGQVNQYDLENALKDATDRTFFAMMGDANREATTSAQNNLTKIDSSDALRQDYVTGYTVGEDGKMYEKTESGKDLLNRLNSMSRDDFAIWHDQMVRSLGTVKSDNSQYTLLTSKMNDANQRAINYSMLRFADKYVDTGKFAAKNFYNGLVVGLSDSMIGNLASLAAGISEEDRNKIANTLYDTAATANFSFDKDGNEVRKVPTSLKAGLITGEIGGIAEDIALMNLATAGTAGIVAGITSKLGKIGKLSNTFAKVGNASGKLARSGGIADLVSNKILSSLASKWGVKGLSRLDGLVKAAITVGAIGAGNALETVEYNLCKIGLNVLSGGEARSMPTFDEFMQDVATDFIIGGTLGSISRFRSVAKAQKRIAKQLGAAGIRGQKPSAFEAMLNDAVAKMDDTDTYKLFKRQQQEASDIAKGNRAINNSDSPLKNMTPNQIRSELLNNSPFKTKAENSNGLDVGVSSALSDTSYSVNKPSGIAGRFNRNQSKVLNNEQVGLSNNAIKDIEIKVKKTVASGSTDFAGSSKKAKATKVKEAVKKSETAQALASGQDPTKAVTKTTAKKTKFNEWYMNAPELYKEIDNRGLSDPLDRLKDIADDLEFNEYLDTLPDNTRNVIIKQIDMFGNRGQYDNASLRRALTSGTSDIVILNTYLDDMAKSSTAKTNTRISKAKTTSKTTKTTTINTTEDIASALKEHGMKSIRSELGDVLTPKEFNNKFMELPEEVRTMIGNYVDKMSNGTEGINQKSILRALMNKDISDAVDALRVSKTKNKTNANIILGPSVVGLIYSLIGNGEQTEQNNIEQQFY